MVYLNKKLLCNVRLLIGEQHLLTFLHSIQRDPPKKLADMSFFWSCAKCR